MKMTLLFKKNVLFFLAFLLAWQPCVWSYPLQDSPLISEKEILPLEFVTLEGEKEICSSYQEDTKTLSQEGSKLSLKDKFIEKFNEGKQWLDKHYPHWKVSLGVGLSVLIAGTLILFFQPNFSPSEKDTDAEEKLRQAEEAERKRKEEAREKAQKKEEKLLRKLGNIALSFEEEAAVEKAAEAAEAAQKAEDEKWEREWNAIRKDDEKKRQEGEKKRQAELIIQKEKKKKKDLIEVNRRFGLSTDPHEMIEKRFKQEENGAGGLLGALGDLHQELKYIRNEDRFSEVLEEEVEVQVGVEKKESTLENTTWGID